jgi:hypothetical protein
LELADARARLVAMAEHGTLRLDSGREVRVEVVDTSLDGAEMVVRETADEHRRPSNLLEIVDAHLTTADRRPAGTTDQLLAADRNRPY